MRWCILTFMLCVAGCTSIRPQPYDITVTSSICEGDAGCIVVSENIKGE